MGILVDTRKRVPQPKTSKLSRMSTKASTKDTEIASMSRSEVKSLDHIDEVGEDAFISLNSLN